MTRQQETRDMGGQKTKRKETERQKTERQVREKQLVLHPSSSIPKTQKYVSSAAASWPGGSCVFGIEEEGWGALDSFGIFQKHKRQEQRREEKGREERREDHT